MKYSLANYIVTISSTDSNIQGIIGQLSIGGGLSDETQGEALGSISIERDEALYSVDNYATGGYVFNKNLSRTGTVELSLNQLSDKIGPLKNLCIYLETHETDGLTITVMDSGVNKVAECIDCYPEKLPAQEFKDTAQEQTWKFLVGQVNFK